MKTAQRLWPLALLVLVVIDIFGPLAFGATEPPLSLHHLEHAFLLLAGGVFGIAYVRRRPLSYGDPLWLFAVLGLGTLSLLMMLPDVYGTVDAQPVLHTALHLGFVVVGWLGGYAAERYAPRLGLGWQLLVVVTGIITATGFGSPPPLA
jgi:hypothetical protein